MNKDVRNTQMMLAFVAAMTTGAALLLALESPDTRPASAALLTAQDVREARGVEVWYVAADETSGFDYVISPDGGPAAPRADGADPQTVYIALVATSDAERFREQVVELLKVLGGLASQQDAPAVLVRLSRQFEKAADLPEHVRWMAELLQKKGIVR